MAHGKADNLTTSDPSPAMIGQWLAPIRTMPPVFSIHAPVFSIRHHVNGPIFGSLPMVLVFSGSPLERAGAGERELIARSVRTSARRAVTGLTHQRSAAEAREVLRAIPSRVFV